MPIHHDPDKLLLGAEVGEYPSNCVGFIVSRAHAANFDFVVLPLSTPEKPSSSPRPIEEPLRAKGPEASEWAAQHGIPGEPASTVGFEFAPATGSDLQVDSGMWTNSVVGCISDKAAHVEVDGCSCCDATQRELNATALISQLRWAAHCSMHATLLPTPLVGRNCEVECANFARLIVPQLSGHAPSPLWVRIPLLIRCQDDKRGTDAEGGSPQYVDGWTLWQKLRSLCEYSPYLSVALEYSSALPDMAHSLDRWMAEPVRAVIIPSGVFLRNQGGYPVLPKKLRSFTERIFGLQPRIILKPDPENARIQGDEDFLHGSLDENFAYIARLFTSQPKLTEAEIFEYPYRDYLQAPLQPLQDNLESQTYETFERDPIKYVQYRTAVWKCLKDREAAGHTRHVIMVVGAGRGPLVQIALEALTEAEIEEFQLYAVEKNPNAVVTLRGRVDNDRNPGWRKVVVVSCDARHWDAPEQADILISELLGSFGDNELSPECLDGAQRFLKEGGVNIPQRYVSSLEPITTSKLWNDCKASSLGPEGVKAFETAYVVRLFGSYCLSQEGPTPCFEFRHPNPRATSRLGNEHNRRYAKLKFTASTMSVIHGLAGYFHCNLYKDVSISIWPGYESKDMFSWFPLFFPLKHPVLVSKGDTVCVHVWRLSDNHRVWYEWALTEPVATDIHNPNGRSYFIGT